MPRVEPLRSQTHRLIPILSIVPGQQLLAQSDAVASSFKQQEKAPGTAGSSSEKASDNNTTTPDPEFASGDLLEVSVFGADFSCGSAKSDCEARVNSSGDIVLPLIGPVRVAGLTIPQAEQLIATRLSQGEFYNSSQVTILQKGMRLRGNQCRR